MPNEIVKLYFCYGFISMATVNHQLNFTTKAFRDKGGEGGEIFIPKRT